jgi:hypothetical protein
MRVVQAVDCHAPPGALPPFPRTPAFLHPVFERQSPQKTGGRITALDVRRQAKKARKTGGGNSLIFNEIRQGNIFNLFPEKH